MPLSKVMAINKKHVYIFKIPKHIKLEFNQLSNLLYTNFYEPYARAILQEWLYWAEDTFPHEQNFYETFVFLNDTSILNELVHWLVIHMSENVESGSGNKYSYAVYTEHRNLKHLILKKVKELMKSKGFC